MVGQHHPAGAEPDALGVGADVRDQHAGRRRRDAGHVVVLGVPDPLVAELLRLLGQRHARGEAVTGGLATSDRRQVKDRQPRWHRRPTLAAACSTRRRDRCAWLVRVSEIVGSAPDHGVVDGAPSVPPPLVQTEPAPRLSPAEEARTLVAATNVAALATLTADGDPWASLITYGALDDGAPVLCLSRLAEHGRNLAGDPRASLIITQVDRPPRPSRRRARHSRRPRRTPVGRRLGRRRPRRAPHGGPGSEHLHRLLGLLALDPAGRSRPLGRWLRPHGLRVRRRPTPPRNPIPSRPAPAPRSRTSTPTTPTLCSRSRRRSAATPMRRPPRAPDLTAAASTLRSTPPAGERPPASRSPTTLTDSAQLRAATVELVQRARAAANAP